MSFFVFICYVINKNMVNNRLFAYCDKYNISLLHLDRSKDFIIYVMNNINKNYLDDEFLEDDNMKEKHFDYWWDRSAKEFTIVSGYDYTDLIKAKEYFKRTAIRIFYKSKLSLTSSFSLLILTINSLFNFKLYGEKEYDIILSIHNLFKHG